MLFTSTLVHLRSHIYINRSQKNQLKITIYKKYSELTLLKKLFDLKLVFWLKYFYCIALRFNFFYIFYIFLLIRKISWISAIKVNLVVHFLLVSKICWISAQAVNYIIVLRFYLLFYILFLLARQRETENVIMLRAKRETASQELEALVRQLRQQW